jgi:hypothetical protein
MNVEKFLGLLTVCFLIYFVAKIIIYLAKYAFCRWLKK